VAGPVAALLTMPQGRFALAAIRDLASRLIAARREFGLTPASRTRVDCGGAAPAWDAIDEALFDQRAELLVPPTKLN
jgi:hypothetical protein